MNGPFGYILAHRGKKPLLGEKLNTKDPPKRINADSFDATMAQFEAEEKLHKKDCDTDVPRNQYIPLRLCIFGAGMSLTQIR